MKFIPMQILEYRFNEEGITEQIAVAFQLYQGSEQVNVRVDLDQEYVTSVNPNWALDSMNKDAIENLARRKVRDWILVERPEEPEVEPEEPVEEE